MNSGSDKVNKRRRKNINCHITDSSLENNKYKHEFVQKFRYRELILRNYRVSDYNNCCEDVKLIIRIKTPYKYNSISGGINRRVEHRSSILNAISATMNKEVYVNKQPVREKKTRRIYQYAGESDLEISLRMGGYDFKPRQEAVRVTIRFRQAQLHIQNKTCILHFAVEYSERLLTIHQCQQRQDLPVTLTHDILRFSCQLPARICDRRVDHKKRNRSICS